jgi:hypothetical protein
MAESTPGAGAMPRDRQNGPTHPPGTTLGVPGAAAFRECFAEELTDVLNLESWRPGVDLAREYARIEREVHEAVQREDHVQRGIREHVIPKIGFAEAAPRDAGKYEVTPEQVAEVHRKLLLNGGVEACDGTCDYHDTLPLTIYQIGVSLVSYKGDQGTWCTRLFRRDLRQSHGNPVEEALELLHRRDRRAAQGHADEGDPLHELARRAVMSYAERAILLNKSDAVWRMGHGSPAPLELLSGGGNPDLAVESIKVIRRLVEGYKKFVFVASEPRARLYLTIGQALRPLEYAIIGTLREQIEGPLAQTHFTGRATVDAAWDGAELPPLGWVQKFRDEVAPRVVVGVYRATALAPAFLFYAHEDHAHLAARIAIADSVLQEHRGFPMLIDLADRVCGSVYGGNSLGEMVNAAYAAAGLPWRYQSERATRNR